MAKREVVEVTCDRCSKVETQAADVKKPDGAELEATFQGEKVSFPDLCTRCRDAVRGYFMRIAKKADDQVKVGDENVEPADNKPPVAGEAPKKKFGFGR